MPIQTHPARPPGEATYGLKLVSEWSLSCHHGANPWFGVGGATFAHVGVQRRRLTDLVLSSASTETDCPRSPMNILLRRFLILAVAVTLLPTAVHAQIRVDTCKTTTAPVQAPFIATGRNVGVSPPGFVDLPGGTPVLHGADVSKYQADANLIQVARCGGTFAYIRVSAGTDWTNETSFSSKWGVARHENLVVGAYHTLTFVPKEPDSATPLTSTSADALFVKHGQDQAKLFLDNFRQLIKLDDGYHLKTVYLPPAVSIIGVPANPKWGGQMTVPRYQSVVCAFIDTVERDPSLGGQPLVLFTDAGTFDQEKLAEAPCIKRVHRLVWLKYPSRGAAGIPETGNDVDTRLVQELCNPQDKSRQCKFHQYTNLGGSALGSVGDGLDLDRFIGTKADLDQIEIRSHL